MNRQCIEQLARLLPHNAIMFTNGRAAGPAPARLADHLTTALNNPGFAHDFVIDFVNRRKPLPPAVHEPILRRAYNHFAGVSTMTDQIMLRVEQLAQLSSGFDRAILHALLISHDCTYKQIAERLALDEQVIRVYEQLHFNVRDRFNEKLYITRIVFPEGRMQLLKTNAVESLSKETRLLQAGHIHGSQEVLWLAGMTPEQEQPSVERSFEDFEKALLANALQLARSGALNSKSAPGIERAKSLLTAKRNQETPGDHAKRLGDLDELMGPGESILETLRQLTDSSVYDARLAAHEIEQAKAKDEGK